MFPTVEEHQGMARAAGADRMQNHGPRYHGDHRRSSLNRYSTNGEVRQARPTRPDPDRPLNVVYWPNGTLSEHNDPSQLDVSTVTHIIYTATSVAWDGNVQLGDDFEMGTFNRARSEALEACRALKNRNPNLKIIVSFGGGTNQSREAFKMIADNEALSRAFGHHTRQLAFQQEIDGIELDWPDPSSQKEAESFIKLTATTEGYLGEDHFGRSFQLCVAVPGLHNTINLFNSMRDLNKLVDFINVRTFELPGPAPESISYHIAPASIEEDSQIPAPGSPTLRSFSRALLTANRQPSWHSIIRLLEAKGTNMRKVTLGIACFGWMFRGATGPGRPFLRKDRIMHKDLPLPGTQEQDGTESGLAYATAETAETATEQCFATYELSTTVLRKAEMIKSKGMAGLCYSNGAEDSDGDRSLIRTGFLALMKDG